MRIVAIVGLLIAAVLPCQAQDAGVALPLNAATWTLSGDARIEPYLGRTALRMRFGGAEPRTLDGFQDGTIDFDLAVDTHRSFPSVQVRKVGDEYEDFYLRIHKSELPDALQYVPAWQGSGGWQLYHGPGFTAAAAFPRHEWFHVRIVLSGTKAAMFIGQADRPQLVVARLRHAPRPGTLAFGAIAPGTPPDAEFTTNISNVIVRPGVVPFDFSTVVDDEPSPRGVVRAWQVSDAFLPAQGLGPALRDAVVADLHWTTVEAEPSGLVPLDQYVRRAPEGQPSVVLARLRVRADTAGLRAFRLGYSDVATVFLNGQPLFTGDAHYSFDNPRQEGLIGLTQAVLYLPLRQGQNEVVVAVGDVFGGWGVMGQFEDAAALQVEP